MAAKPVPPTRLPQVRLSRQRQEELVERCRAEVLRRELAEAYGIGTGTVSNILKRHGATQARGLEPHLITSAATRYENGDSLATIADASGSTADTVRTALPARGVVMRSTSGARA